MLIFLLYFSVLKDEPDDLTHLAPTAGDACIPLDEFSDMFDDFILPDNYNTLLNDELNSLDSSSSKLTTSSNCSNSNDPFIVYRDDSSDICQSPNLVSPAGFSKVNITLEPCVTYHEVDLRQKCSSSHKTRTAYISIM